MFRLVAYIRAEVEPEIAADPLLGEVGWTWLEEALDAHVPGYSASSGTVTRVITEGFGAKREELPLTGFELRASWLPYRAREQRGASARPAPGPRPVGGDVEALTWRHTSPPGATACAARPGWSRQGQGALRRPGRG